MTIYEVLGYGKRNARRKVDLARELGCSTREVEQAIQKARLEGGAICSDEMGYWIGTAAEVADCARRLRSRYVNQALTARALRATARRLERREDLILFGDTA